MGCPRAASLLEPSACLRVRPHVFVGREAEAQPAHPADARGLAELERRERSGGGGRALLCTVSCLRCSCCCRLRWLLYFGRTDACFPSILRHEDHLSHHLDGAEAVAQRRPHLAIDVHPRQDVVKGAKLLEFAGGWAHCEKTGAKTAGAHGRRALGL